MHHPTRAMTAALAALCLTAPFAVHADDNTAHTCNVLVDHARNNVLVERYVRDFVVTRDAPLVDDFGTRLRAKQFSASVARDGGTSVVAFDVHSDVGVFHSIAFNSSLTLRGGGDVQSASGSNSFATSTGIVPGAVSGNHVTTCTVACRKA